jgi:2-C-methyl-D-erythritol 4-phosphate cytidylyltransferase
MSSSQPLPRDVGVIVVAAGRGTRLGGEPKQFRLIGGVPLLLRTLRPFLAHPEVETVVAVLPEEIAAAPPRWLADLAGERLRLAVGGPVRADSVRSGLSVLTAQCRVVLVHDGARPFPRREVVDRVIALSRAGVAAVAAVPVSDTLKEADPGGGREPRVARTVSRVGLWRAQTPQGFPRDLLERAHAARRDGEDPSDDAVLVEQLGAEVALVPDSPLNLKVTSPEDLVLAEAISSIHP